MDIKTKENGSNGQVDKKKIESLLNLLLTTYLGRRKTLDFEKAAVLKEQLINFIERGKNTVSPETYDKMLRVVDRFDRLLKLPGVMDEIKYSGINSKEFLQKYRRALMGNERTKYDMSDLYSTKAVAFKPNTYLPNEKLTLHLNNSFTKTFVTRDGRMVFITPVGTLDYQRSIKVWYDYLTLFKVSQEREKMSGKFDTDFIYSKFNLHDLENNEELKYAILEGLLDKDNIDKANCGGYVGAVCKQSKTDENDTVHSENITDTGYTYRLSDNYVLVYDDTEVSAAINMPTSKINLKQRDNKALNDEQHFHSKRLKLDDSKANSKQQTATNKRARNIVFKTQGRHFAVKGTNLKGKHYREKNANYKNNRNDGEER